MQIKKKYCYDCKWYIAGWHEECRHPKNKKINENVKKIWISYDKNFAYKMNNNHDCPLFIKGSFLQMQMTIIRILLSLLLCWGVYTETGSYTAISFFLIFIAIEVLILIEKKM